MKEIGATPDYTFSVDFPRAFYCSIAGLNPSTLDFFCKVRQNVDMCLLSSFLFIASADLFLRNLLGVVCGLLPTCFTDFAFDIPYLCCEITFDFYAIVFW